MLLLRWGRLRHARTAAAPSPPARDLSRRAACLLVLAVQAASLLAGCGDRSAPDAPPAMDEAARAALATQLEARLGPGAAALRRLLGGTDILDGTSGRPESLGDLLGRVLPAGLSPLPIPTPPREGALAAAVQAYGAEMGVSTPSAPELALLTRPLGLDADGEYALAQLVLAYTQALHLQREATSGLASGAPPDLDLTLQAADLLARTAELVRGPLGRPPQPPSPPDSWEVLRGVLLRGAPSPTLPPFSSSLRLADALASLAAAHGVQADFIPAPALPASLDHAVALIVQAKAEGASHDGTWASLRMLQAVQEAQPTLEAWAALLRMPGPPAVDAQAALAEAVARTPDAAAIVAALHGHPRDGPSPVPSLVGLLQSHGLSASDAAAVHAGLPGAAADALALLVDAHDRLQRARADAFAGLTSRQSAAVAASFLVFPLLAKPAWNASEAEAVREWAKDMASLDGAHWDLLGRAQDAALAEVGQATQLLKGLQAPQDSAGPPSPVPVPPVPPAASSLTATATSTASALASTATSTASALASAATSTVQRTLAGLCNPLLPGSDCGNNVLFRSIDRNRTSILVAGFGSSRIDGRYGDVPDIVLDLGGNDVYTMPVGVSIDTNPFNITFTRPGISLAIDAGGSDTYGPSPTSASQGVAIGLGTLGLLADLKGDDRYLHDRRGAAQGFAAFGGVGVLADLGGSDTYSAPDGMAQGASDLAIGVAAAYERNVTVLNTITRQPFTSLQGATPLDFMALYNDTGLRNLTFLLPGGVGLLLDGGEGRDDYTALSGQGFSTWTGTGLLVDAGGDGRYTTLDARGVYQGGRDRGAIRVNRATLNTPGLGALVDLGGNDTYSNAFLPLNQVVFTQPGAPQERHNDAMWIDPDNGLGIGIDSSLEDTDGNGDPDLVDVLGGGPGSNAVQLLLATVDRTRAAASDPQGALDAARDTLFDDRLLCNAYEPGACTAANRIDTFTCDPERPLSCLSLLTLTGVDGTLHDHPALVSIDLGGDDLYETSVAGTYIQTPLTTSSQRGQDGFNPEGNSTGFSLDLDGDDHYLAPDGLPGTQAADTIAGDRGDAALLLDLRGDDAYVAGDDSQGFTRGGNTVALLADIDGDDTYRGGSRSQGAVACAPVVLHRNVSAAEPCTAASLGALVDLRGDDRYAFRTQGAALPDPSNGNVGGTALLLDLLGRDTYTSSLPVDEDGLSLAHPDAAFRSQGVSEGGQGATLPVPFFAGLVAQGIGVFLDAGDEAEPDLYEAPAASGDGPPLDLSRYKENAVRGDGRWVGNGTGAGRFADNPRGAFRDLDGDDVPGWLEIVAGTDPNDPGDFPGSAAQCARLADDPTAINPQSGACLGQDPAACTQGMPSVDAADPTSCVGGNDPVANATTPLQALVGPSPIQLAQGLLVGGHGDTTYGGRMPPFFVDLGGDDNYTAPNTGGAVTLWDTTGNANSGEANPAVVLLLDAAAGDDDYLPSTPPCSQRAGFVAVPGTGGGECGPSADATMCGGTVAITSGRNSAEPFGPCPVLGAALGGISILADDGGSNHFVSRLEVKGTVAGGEDAGQLVNPHVALRGLSQGAGAAGGIGILATWNAANTFLATVEVNLVRQGLPRSGTPDLTASGNSQGAGVAGGIGILAAFGPGNDIYASQTLAQVTSTFEGVEVEANATAACSQGSACPGTALSAAVIPGNTRPSFDSEAVGILYDGGGENQFLANGSFAQGSALIINPLSGTKQSGIGLLWSGEGSDRYEAGASSQATASGKRGGIVAALVDTGGSDTYTILRPVGSCTAGQGSAANNSALLLDLAGDDRFDAKPCSNAQGSGSGYLVDVAGDDAYFAQSRGTTNLIDLQGRNSYWTPSSTTTKTGTLAPVQDSLALVAALNATTDTKVDLSSVGPGRSEAVNFTAWVKPSPTGAQKVDRVSFRLNGILLGDGVPGIRQENGTTPYTFSLDTTTFHRDVPNVADGPDYPDGSYNVQASVFLVPPDGQSRADLYAVQSNVVSFTIDNPPVPLSAPRLALSKPDLLGISPELGQYATVSLDLFPGLDGKGANFTVVGTDGQDIQWQMRNGTAPAGVSTVYFTPPPTLNSLPTTSQNPFVCQLNPPGGSTSYSSTNPLSGFQDDGYYLLFRNAMPSNGAKLAVNDLRLVPSPTWPSPAKAAGTVVTEADTAERSVTLITTGTSPPPNAKCWTPVFGVVDANGDLIYDVGDWVYLDSTTILQHAPTSGSNYQKRVTGLSLGDIRLTATDAGHVAGTITKSDESDLKKPDGTARSFDTGTGFPALNLRFHDHDGSGTFNGTRDPNDRLYASTAPQASPWLAAVGDVRLYGNTGPFGSQVERLADADLSPAPQCTQWNNATRRAEGPTGRCADGLYKLGVFLQDDLRSGTRNGTWANVAPPTKKDDASSTKKVLGLLIDSTGPRSRITLGPPGATQVYAGDSPNHLEDDDVYFVPAEGDDAEPGVSVAGEVSLALVQVQRNPDGTYGSPQEVEAKRLTGIDHTDTVYLMSLSRDALGNQESSCQGAGDLLSTTGGDFCYQTKLDNTLGTNVTAVTFDFRRPVVSNPFLSPLYAKPGTRVGFNATVTEDGVGIAAQSVTLGGGLEILDLEDTGLHHNANATWDTSKSAALESWKGHEVPYTATFAAADRAGNAAEARTLKGYLDGLAPRVDIVRIFYAEPSGANPTPMGNPRQVAHVQVALRDIPSIGFDSIATLTADASPLGGSRTTVCPPLKGEFGLWACSIILPPEAHGNYTIQLNATDKAGNANTAVEATLQVNGDPPAIVEPASAVPGDLSFTVHWKTDRPASTVLLYGPASADSRQRVEGDGGLSRNHTITVTGLEPFTTYAFRGESTTLAGVTSRTPPDDGEVTTNHGFLLELEEMATDLPRAGAFNVTVRAQDVVGRGAADVVLKLQELHADGRDSPDEHDRATLLGVAARAFGPLPKVCFVDADNDARLDPAEPLLLQPACGPVAIGSLRLTPDVDAPGGTLVAPKESAAASRSLNVSAIPRLAFLDTNRNATYDAGEPLALSMEGTDTLRAGDVLLSGGSAFTRVTAADVALLGTPPLVPTPARLGDIGWVDADNSKALGPGDRLSLHPGASASVENLRVNAGDLRLTASAAGPAGSVVAPGDPDDARDARTFRLDTVGIPDGLYRIVVEAVRGSDAFTYDDNTTLNQAILSPPFRIDNTPPILSPLEPMEGEVVTAPQPQLVLRAVEPGGDALPGLATLELAVDGSPAIPTQVTSLPVPDDARQVVLRMRPPGRLSDGRHMVEVSLSDAAGNRGVVRWNLTVDTRPPLLDGARLDMGPDRTAVPPGGNVTLRLNLTDAHEVGSASVDLQPFGGLVPLLARDGGWEAAFRLPAGLPDGPASFRVEAVDGLGNSGLAGTVEVPVDGTPPALRLEADGAGRTGFTLHANLSEPATLAVLEAGRVLATGNASAGPSSLGVPGLRPGREHTLTVRATDGAGNVAQATLAVRTLEDTQPPSAAGPLLAASEEEGVVELRWTAATDDSGVQNYTLARSGEQAPPLLVRLPPNATSYRDTAAPAGRLATYTLHATDVADLDGPPAASTLEVLALPHLLDAGIGPGRGTTDTPFTVHATYRHLAGTPADSLGLLVGNVPHPMRQVGSDCVAGCRYEATLQLPATSLVSPTTFTVRANAGGHTAELVLAAPAVKLGHTGNAVGVEEGIQEAPMPVAALEALALLGLAGLARRRR